MAVFFIVLVRTIIKSQGGPNKAKEDAVVDATIAREAAQQPLVRRTLPASDRDSRRRATNRQFCDAPSVAAVGEHSLRGGSRSELPVSRANVQAYGLMTRTYD